MSLHHSLYCRSNAWGRKLENDIIPWLLMDVELGNLTLEVGPGPGVGTRIVQRYSNSLVVLERQVQLLRTLRSRLGVTTPIIAGDAVAMPFASERFTSIVSIMVLHHVWRIGARKQLLEESFRVLRPGGIFIGVDATPIAVERRLVHLGDRILAVNGSDLLGELTETGFEAATVEYRRTKFKFSAIRPK